MSGALRAMAYQTAAATGFRAEELRTLSAESFHLDDDEPEVSLEASATRNPEPEKQPLPT